MVFSTFQNLTQYLSQIGVKKIETIPNLFIDHSMLNSNISALAVTPTGFDCEWIMEIELWVEKSKIVIRSDRLIEMTAYGRGSKLRYAQPDKAYGEMALSTLKFSI